MRKLVTTTGAFDRSAIMSRAWADARERARFSRAMERPERTWSYWLRRTLADAWWAARAERAAFDRTAREANTYAGRSIANLQAERESILMSAGSRTNLSRRLAPLDARIATMQRAA